MVFPIFECSMAYNNNFVIIFKKFIYLCSCSRLNWKFYNYVRRHNRLNAIKLLSWKLELIKILGILYDYFWIINCFIILSKRNLKSTKSFWINDSNASILYNHTFNINAIWNIIFWIFWKNDPNSIKVFCIWNNINNFWLYFSRNKSLSKCKSTIWRSFTRLISMDLRFRKKRFRYNLRVKWLLIR